MPPARESTITERFRAFDSRNPDVYRALERMTARRIAAGASRIGMKDLFEDLRRLRYSRLNNNFTALYVRKLLVEHPEWASLFELRRRRAA